MGDPGTDLGTGYGKTVLENGIRVVTEAMPGACSISLGILIGSGPQNESPQHQGLAHLTEHVLFQGTSSRSAFAIAHMMDVAGGHLGGVTARDYTCLFATVLDDYGTYVLDLLGDILLNPTFPAAAIEREKQAILCEMDAVQDCPGERVEQMLKAFHWPSHPLGRPVMGRPETVARLTRDDVIYFFHEHYVPDRLIVAAAGHLDHNDLVAQVRDAFWRLLGRGQPVGDSAPERRGGVTIEAAPLSQAYFGLGLPAPRYVDPDRYAWHVLNTLLGGGVSSRLHRVIREERGLAYAIGSEYHAYRDVGMLVVEGSTAPENLPAVLALVLQEVTRLVSGEVVDEEELWRAKMNLRGQHLLGLESSHTRMSRLATQEFYFGRRVPTAEIMAGIGAVDAAALRRLAQGSLASGLRHAAVAVIGPPAPGDDVAATVEAVLEEFGHHAPCAS